MRTLYTTLKMLTYLPATALPAGSSHVRCQESFRGSIASLHLIMGLLEWLNRKGGQRPPLLSVTHLKSVAFKLVNPYPVGTRRLSEGNPHKDGTDGQLYITHSSIHLPRMGQHSVQPISFFTHPPPLVLLWPLESQIKTLVSEKLPLLIYQNTSNHRLFIFPFLHIFLLNGKLSSRRTILWSVLGCSEFRKAKPVKVNDADSLKCSWNALQDYQIFWHKFYKPMDKSFRWFISELLCFMK